MTPFDEEVLTLAMRQCQAWERLNDHSYSGTLDTGAFYELLLEAGYSEGQARRAASKRGWDRLQMGVAL